MPQIVRFGCAGVAVIIIAALTSVGLYAVLTGGFPFAGPAPKPVSGGAQVLVTIQASQPTPTPPSASTPTPAGGSGAPGSPSAPASALAAPAAPAPTATIPPTATPTVAPLQTPPVGASPGAAAASPAAGPVRHGVGSVSLPDPARQTTYEGLAAEIIEIERGWQPTDVTGAPIRLRDGAELVTVHMRMTNNAPEARYVSENDLVLVSEDGARYAPRQSGPQREPRLLTTPLLPSDIVRGWLTFETQAGLPTRRLQWSPTRPDRPRAETAFNLTLP